MTLDLWNENKNFNDAYNECDKINRMIRDFENSGRTMSGMIIKDGDYRRNDSINPFANRLPSINKTETTNEQKKSGKLQKLKGVLVVGGVIGLSYVGYKFIFKPLKKEYDNLMDNIIVKCESEKPLNGRIRVMTPLERKAYDHKYGKETLILTGTEYVVHDDKNSTID